jgi:hypothetical protein
MKRTPLQKLEREIRIPLVTINSIPLRYQIPSEKASILLFSGAWRGHDKVKGPTAILREKP